MSFKSTTDKKKAANEDAEPAPKYAQSPARPDFLLLSDCDYYKYKELSSSHITYYSKVPKKRKLDNLERDLNASAENQEILSSHSPLLLDSGDQDHDHHDDRRRKAVQDEPPAFVPVSDNDPNATTQHGKKNSLTNELTRTQKDDKILYFEPKRPSDLFSKK